MRRVFGCLFLLPLGILRSFADGPPTKEPPPSVPPHENVRGLPPDARKAIEQRNADAVYTWLKELPPEQRASWYAAQGKADPASERRLGTQALPQTNRGYDWRVVARSNGLKESELGQLERDKLLIEDISLKQSFEAYTFPREPVFITSDSILNAFHVLFEDSFQELEVHRAIELRHQLENVLTTARSLMARETDRSSATDLQPGWQHAQLVVGPALRLLGTGREFFDAAVRDEIERQVEKIRTGTAVELPAFLGPATHTLVAVDYRRCQPAGFYAETESLQNYFRAVRWLQSIPFRATRDTELTAIGLLGYAAREDRNEAEQFFDRYQSILGRPDDPSLSEAAYEFQNFLMNSHRHPWRQMLHTKRLWLLRDHYDLDDWKKLNDALSLSPDAAKTLAKIEFRVLSGYRLPDSLVLAKTATPGKLPGGLVVATMLDSDFARRQLGDIDQGPLESALKEAREDWHPTVKYRSSHSVYDDYLDTLAALNLPAEPEAPDFMRGLPWAAKSCQTILGSWAQMRHTFSLQAKQNAMYLGLVDLPPGFVEPNPEFFGRLADLVTQITQRLEADGAFNSTAEVEASRLRSAAAELESFRFHLPGASFKDVQQLNHKRKLVYEHAMRSAAEADRMEAEFEFTSATKPAEFQAFHRDVISGLRARADDFEKGKRQPDPTGAGDRVRWNKLQEVTRRLESLAHKQLRRQPWTRTEAAFIRGYGEQLGLIMGYYGNAWLHPRDDAPRWATVASDPNAGTMLAVAVGRARLIHVLYPWQGDEILCAGAVMSYYEYTETQILTDEAWQAKLDSKDAPPEPAWISTYLAK